MVPQSSKRHAVRLAVCDFFCRLDCVEANILSMCKEDDGRECKDMVGEILVPGQRVIAKWQIETYQNYNWYGPTK